MAKDRLDQLVPQLRQALLQGDAQALSDAPLLDGWVRDRDAAALEALVRRHARMVWGVCRRILINHHDAEDAFQATFLVLLRKAASVHPRHLLANWLYGVAHQTARKARATAMKRRTREKLLPAMPEPAVVDKEARSALDDELSRLPEKYRIALVLCDLEGRTRKEVARQLGLREGTVASRLARARGLLAERLGRRGAAVGGGVLLAHLSQEAKAAVPPGLVPAVLKIMTGKAEVTASVLSLSKGVLKTMWTTRLTAIVSLLFILAALGTGAGLLLQHAVRAGSQAGPQATAASAEKASQPARTDARLQGIWKAVKLTANGGESHPDLRLTFDGDRLVYRDPTFIDEGTYAADPEADPARLDLRVSRLTMPAIYRFEGERLILATSGWWGGRRPKDFTAPKGEDNRAVYVLERVPAAKARAADESPAEKLKVARLRTGGHMRRLVLAIWSYHDAHGKYPSAAIADDAGRPLLSWRVALLPYLGEKDLYEQFRLDEPWDSEHNKKLLPRMPKVFASVGNAPKVPHGTFYQVLVGPGCLFEEGKTVTVRDVADGTVNTIALVTASEAVPWTKPADVAYAADRPLPDFTGSVLDDGLMSLATADGSVHLTSNAFGPEKERAFRAMATRSGGEDIDWEKLKE